MPPIVFIFIFSVLFGLTGYSQNQAVAKIVLPGKVFISSLKTITPTVYQSLHRINYTEEPVNNSLLHFNDQPLLKLNKIARKPVLLFTELSFSDLFENSMNGLKADLINTYDDHMPELFNDAPSFFKVKCIIQL